MKYNMQKEIWKPIKDFETKYEISNKGRIRNLRTGNILKMTNQYGDYFRIVLYDEAKKKSCYIHRLVAEHFIDNPYKYPCINHKDLNKQNNDASNLEWCTYSYNSKDAILKGANTMSGFNKYNKNKFKNKYGKIFQCDRDKNVINIFDSLNEAHNKTGVCARNILHCINHQEGRTQAGGYIWESEKEVMNNEI